MRKNILDFNSITYEDIISIEGYGEKSTITLYDNIQNALKNINEIDFLASFSIPGWGKTMIDKLLCIAGDLPSIFEMNKEALMDIDGVGGKLADNLLEAIECENLINIYGVYSENITLPAKEHNNITKVQHEEETGERICFTGTFTEKKSHYEAIAEDKGYVISKVDKKLNILVVPDIEWNSNKVKKAKTIEGCKILTLEEWL